MTDAYPYPTTCEYVNAILARVQARPDDEWWVREYNDTFENFGYHQHLKAGIDKKLWWERVEELQAIYEWPIPWDVATYEALDQRGLWPQT